MNDKLSTPEASKTDAIAGAATTDAAAIVLNNLASICHDANKKWWLDLARKCSYCVGFGEILKVGDDLYTCESSMIGPDRKIERILCIRCDGNGYRKKDRNVGELLMLIVSELSEAMEGNRKDLMDDHLPHRKMEEVEIADAFIRLFDFCGGRGLDVGGAFVEKMAYNAKRADHKIENRLAPGGKAY